MKTLDKMTAAELEALSKEAASLAESKKEGEKRDLRSRLVEQIKEAGYNIDDIFPGSASVKTKTQSVAKYRDPSNPENTWTGRGRKPGWLVEAETAGRSLSEFEI